MLVMLGTNLMDTFFTCSALLAFYKVNKLYQQQDGLSLLMIFKLYLKRFLRFAPTVYAVFFFGVYVMPHLHGNPADSEVDPIWYSFEQVLFYRCTETPIILSKLFFYSNLAPMF